MFESYRSQQKDGAPLSGATTQEEKRNSNIKYLIDIAPFVFVIMCLVVLGYVMSFSSGSDEIQHQFGFAPGHMQQDADLNFGQYQPLVQV